MIREKWLAIKQGFQTLSLQEKLFIVAAMFCGFFISAEYAVVRPVSNSLFISSYGTAFFPYAWVATVPLNLFIVFLYNRYLPKLGCVKTFLASAFTIMGVNLFFALFMQTQPFLPFLFYTWKEVYVLLMFQQLWSIIHTTIKTERAKYLYGPLFAVGGLGGMLGSMFPGFFAVKMGSENLLFATCPLYLLLIFFYLFALKYSEVGKKEQDLRTLSPKTHPPLRHSLKLIKESRFLLFILLIVTFMQLSSTIIDYQFNTSLEVAVQGKDLRTEYCGKVFSIVNCLTICLQLIGSFLLLHFLGLKRSHLFIPCVLCLNALGFVLFPVFGVISFSYIIIKAFDFSLFGVIKEMLYIPMSMDEKFRAKSIIDVFAYRTSKALASLLILGAQFWIGSRILPLLTWGCVGIFLLWGLAIVGLFRQQEKAPYPETP